MLKHYTSPGGGRAARTPTGLGRGPALCNVPTLPGGTSGPYTEGLEPLRADPSRFLGNDGGPLSACNGIFEK